MRRIRNLFIFLLFVLLIAGFIFLGQNQQEKKSSLKEYKKEHSLIYPNSEVSFVSKNSLRELLIFTSKDSPESIRSYYIILAAEKGWNLVSEVEVKNGLVLSFKSKTKNIDLLIQREGEKTRITLSIN